MVRAAVLIGVAKSGSLPELKDAILSVRAMERWAISQGMAHVLVFTDESGPVEPGPIKSALKQLVNSAVVEQLVIYFSGHGVNNRYNEYWLLTDAPDDPQAAINLSGSMTLARYCGIPHVIFFSDACRTAAEGIQAQNVSGSDIFPNNPPAGHRAFVDVFWATGLGAPAYEIRDVSKASSLYRAIYTDALIEALAGKLTDLVEVESPNPGVQEGLVRPWPLSDYLYAAIPSKLLDIGNAELYQVPEAQITSKAKAWISRIKLDTEQAVEPIKHQTPSRASDRAEVPTSQFSSAALNVALNPGRMYVQDPLSNYREAGYTEPFFDRIRQQEQTVGPDRYESQCGFKIQGTRCIEAIATQFHTEIIDPSWEAPAVDAWPAKDHQLIRVWPSDLPSIVDPVLLVMERGDSVMLPAISEFLATVRVDETGVVDVTYEPSRGSTRWDRYLGRTAEVRKLRSLISVSSYFGVFRLSSEEDISALARQMQVAKGLDPTLAIYSGYAYLQAGKPEPISHMADILHRDMRFSFFDVAMLSGNLRGSNLRPIVPSFPLLSQGWALMNALGAEQEISRELSRYVRQSLWTTFDPSGTELLKELMKRELHIVR